MCHRIALWLWGFHNWGYPPNHRLSKWIFLNHPAIGLSRTPIATPPVITVSGSLPRKHLFEQLEACGRAGEVWGASQTRWENRCHDLPSGNWTAMENRWKSHIYSWLMLISLFKMVIFQFASSKRLPEGSHQPPSSAQLLDRYHQSWTKQWRERRSTGHANKGTCGGRAPVAIAGEKDSLSKRWMVINHL